MEEGEEIRSRKQVQRLVLEPARCPKSVINFKPHKRVQMEDYERGEHERSVGKERQTSKI